LKFLGTNHDLSKFFYHHNNSQRFILSICFHMVLHRINNLSLWVVLQLLHNSHINCKFLIHHIHCHLHILHFFFLWKNTKQLFLPIDELIVEKLLHRLQEDQGLWISSILFIIISWIWLLDFNIFYCKISAKNMLNFIVINKLQLHH
jgi:hypothetical protein